tara:strand:+ start:210 stop:776 length:567 start_codon:yes stop_codon:yes gene_type:complete
MRYDLFEYPCFKYQIPNWEISVKQTILNRINLSKFEKDSLGNFETDRKYSDYTQYIQDLILPELNLFCLEAQLSCHMTDAWTARYSAGDSQSVHNHCSYGFSGIIYIEYDSSIHSPTCFVAPWQDPKTDKTILKYPDVTEGSIIIFPSYTLHYVEPNRSDKRRTILSFDLKPDESRYQSKHYGGIESE